MSIPVMDAYETIKSFEFSLKTICAVNVVHQVLDSVETNGMDYQDFSSTKMLEHINTEASKRVEQLCLPTELKELLAGLVKPICDEWDAWHNEDIYDVCPIWNPHGTVDMVQSTRAVVDDPKLKTSYRFVVASVFCHERQIFELARQLTDREKADITDLPDSEWISVLSGFNPNYTYWSNVALNYLWRPLTEFWINVIQGGGGFHVPQHMCEKGLRIALNRKNVPAAMYFLGKLDPEGIRSLLNDPDNAGSLLFGDTLSPATHCSLFFKVSDRDLRLRFLDDFVRNLLMSLTSWPYQTLFLSVARSLFVRAYDRTFLKSLEHIVRKSADGYKDFDYRGLFLGFYEMIVSFDPEWSMSKHVRLDFVVDALRTEDELWINFIFGKFSDPEKEHLLLDDHCHICARLISYRKMHLLEPFIRLCGVRRTDVLLKINDTLRFPRSMSRVKSNGESVETLGRRLISHAVDKVIAEQETAIDDAMPR